MLATTILYAVIVGISLFVLVCLLRDKEFTHREKALSYVAVAALLLTACLMLRVSVRNLRTDTAGRKTSWVLVSDHATATVYNAVASQCNTDFLHTASMFAIVPSRIERDRVLAMERTMMAEAGISYGDTVLVVGAGRWDGEWQVQDTMNKRFKGQHKIDFLVPQQYRHGKWKNVKVYKKIQNI